MRLFVRCVLTIVLLVWSSGAAPATTVIEKNLDALINEADQVFVGTVTSVRSDWTDSMHRDIETVVTFGDLLPLAGVDAPTIELRFAGGQVGDLIEHIAGMPQFTVNDRLVIFAHRDHSASSLVGFHQGCFRVDGTGENASVTVPSYERMGTLSDGRSVVSDAPKTITTIPLPDFLTDIRHRLAQRDGAAQ